MLEGQNLSVSIEDKLILDNLSLERKRRRGRGNYGPERLWQVDIGLCFGGQARLQGHIGSDFARRREFCWSFSRTSAP